MEKHEIVVPEQRFTQRTIYGTIVFLLSFVPAVHTAAELVFIIRGSKTFDETAMLTFPLDYAGHKVDAHDSLMVTNPIPGSRIAGDIWLTIDDINILNGTTGLIRPEHEGFGRYQFWIAMVEYRNLKTNERFLMIAQRRGLSRTAKHGFDLITVRSDGSMNLEYVPRRDRSRNYQTYRTLQFLSTARLPVYDYAIDGFIIPLTPWIYPFGTLLLSIALLAPLRNHRRR